MNWVYSEQQAHKAIGRGLVRLGYGEISADGVARIAELNRLDCRVDVSASDAGKLHPVAETLHYLAGQIPSAAPGTRRGCLALRRAEGVASRL